MVVAASSISRWLLPVLAAGLAALTVAFVLLDAADPLAISLLEGGLSLALAGLLFWVGYRRVAGADVAPDEARLVARTLERVPEPDDAFALLER